jgi:N-acetylneuraminic acid mutarotase
MWPRSFPVTARRGPADLLIAACIVVLALPACAGKVSPTPASTPSAGTGQATAGVTPGEQGGGSPGVPPRDGTYDDRSSVRAGPGPHRSTPRSTASSARSSSPTPTTSVLSLTGWTSVAAMTVPRVSPVTAVLHDGRVLVSGGSSSAGPEPVTASVEIYDPRRNAWATVAGMTTPRYDATATVLRDGRVLVVGGFDGGYEATSSAEIYDPTSNSWTRTGRLATARGSHGAALLPDGRVLVAGGHSGHGKQLAPLATAEYWSPATGTWWPAPTMSHDYEATRAVSLPDGRVLACGPDPAVSEILDPRGDRWSDIGPVPVGQCDSLAVLTDGRVLAVGGGRGTAVWSPAAGWSGAGVLLAGHQYPATTRLPDGRVLLAGGLEAEDSGNTVVADAEIYDPGTDSWAGAGAMRSPRWSFGMVTLQDGRVVAIGGEAAVNGAPLDAVEQWSPPSG